MSSENQVPTNVQVPEGFALVRVPEGKQRAERVNDETFIKTYVRLAKQGKTTEEIADALKMNVLSVISRASATRKRFSADNVAFPIAHRKKGAGRTSQKMSPEQLRQFINSLNA
jgi:hypothetical protein